VPEYLSCYSIALSDDLEAAKKQSHDNVIAGAGADRLSGVTWTFWSTDEAPILRADAGEIVLPPDVALLCALAPGRTLVMATVEVKPL
jgi:hypothetical protein